jgi:NAD+ kinase
MIVALFPNLSVEEAPKTTEWIIQFFKENNVSVVMEKEISSQFNVESIGDVDNSHIEFLITLGGDGSILGVAHKYAHLKAAILGINLGHLGFMADIPLTELQSSLEDLLKGEYVIEERIRLTGKTQNDEQSFALNDFVFYRGVNRSLVELSVHVNGIYFNSYKADGLIVATPNGSTAYSLAAGGPIVMPGTNSCVLTPICAHTISVRPIVIPSECEIEVRYLSDYEPIEVTADGIESFELQKNEAFEIRQSKQSFRLVSLLRNDYFSTLRSKLGWTGKLLTRHEK